MSLMKGKQKVTEGGVSCESEHNNGNSSAVFIFPLSNQKCSVMFLQHSLSKVIRYTF